MILALILAGGSACGEPRQTTTGTMNRDADATTKVPAHVQNLTLLDLDSMSEEQLAEHIVSLRLHYQELGEVQQKLSVTNKHLCHSALELRRKCPLTRPLNGSVLSNAGCEAAGDAEAVRVEVSSSAVSWQLIVDDRYFSQPFSAPADITFSDKTHPSADIKASFKKIQSLELSVASSQAVSPNDLAALNFKLFVGSHKIIDQSVDVDVISWKEEGKKAAIKLDRLQHQAKSAACNPNIPDLMARINAQVEEELSKQK